MSSTAAVAEFESPAPAEISSPSRADADWQLSAESITLQIRWFGLIVGYLLVNILSPTESRPYSNGILTLGAIYALFDLAWHWRGEVFLKRMPLFVSLMEAIFIGLLCHFDRGLESFFRYYYFLSLLVCAIRYSPTVTYSTFALHAGSYALLAVTHGVRSHEQAVSLGLVLVFMGWATWASTSLTMLLRATGQKLSSLNQQLEARIHRRTRELQQSQAMLVQQEKQAAFGLLAAGIAHEVGNPLAAISSLVQMMNRRNLDDEMHERLGLIDEQLLRIQRTLRELVEFSRPGTSECIRLDVHEVIQNALNIAKYYKRKKGKMVLTDFACSPAAITAVRDQLLQVYLNLILNALDATGEGGGDRDLHTLGIRARSGPGEGQRLRDCRRGPGEAVRAVLHNEDHGDRSGPVRLQKHRGSERGHDRTGPLPAGGNDLSSHPPGTMTGGRESAGENAPASPRTRRPQTRPRGPQTIHARGGSARGGSAP